MGELQKYTVVLVASYQYDPGVTMAVEYVQATTPTLAFKVAEDKASLHGDSVDVAFMCAGWHADAFSPQLRGIRLNENTVVIDGVTYTREG